MKRQILSIITLICSATNTLHIQGMDCIASSSSTTTSPTSTAIKHFTPPLTLKQYRALNDPQRYELREELDQSKELQRHPLLDENNRWLFTMIAKELNEKYPNALIYGLGQTPSYLIAAMQAMSSNSERYFCIPFSGNFCDVSKRSITGGDGLLCLNQTWAITNDTSVDLKQYQPVLNALGLQLTDILKRYELNKQKTVIVEFSISCSGIASFLTVVCNQAPSLSDEQLKLLHEALDIIVMIDPRSGKADTQKLLVPGMNDMLSITLKKTGNLFTLLSDCDKYNDRLVPKFSYDKWDTNPFAFIPSRNTNLLLAHIYRFLKD